MAIFSRRIVLLCMLSWFTVLSAFFQAKAEEKWAVYYGHSLPAEDFLPYDVVVFDGKKHPPLRPLLNQGKYLLGYLSAGEAEKYRADFEELKQKKLLLMENKDWPGHYIVDVRNPHWGEYLIQEKIPELLHKQFDGIMLDTLDSPLYLEEASPKQYEGMRKAVVELVQAIRMHFPNIKIMVNRGLPVLKEMAPSIDMLLAESILVKHDADNPDKVTYFDKRIYQGILDLINESKEIAPQLKVYSLDYVHNDDVNIVNEIYTMQRNNGLIPYVSTLDLQTLKAEPAK